MSETTKQGLDEAETGDESGAPLVIHEEKKRSEDAEAAEQERSDGPKGRGVAR